MRSQDRNSVRFSLKVKAIAFVTIVTLAVGGFLSWRFLSQSKEILNEDLMERALSITKNLAYNSKYAVLTEDPEILKSVAEGALQNDSVVYVRICNAQGRILMEMPSRQSMSASLNPVFSHADQLGRYEGKAFGQYHLINGTPFYHTYSPVVGKTANTSREKKLSADIMMMGAEDIPDKPAAPKIVREGSVQLVLSSEHMLAQVHHTLLDGAILTLSIILAAVVVSFVVIGYVIRPVTAIAQAARRIGEGDLTQRIGVTSKDEIGVLAATFNHMSESLENMTASQQRQLAELSALHDIGLAMISTQDLGHLIGLTLEAVVRDLGYDRAIYFEKNDKTGMLCNGRASGISATDENRLRNISIPLNDGATPCTNVAITGKPMLIEDMASQNFGPCNITAQIPGAKSLVVVPVKFETEILGIMVVARTNRRAPLALADMQMITTLCNQLAMAMKNILSYQQIEALNQGLEAEVEKRTAELVQSRDEAEAASRAKSVFLANMSHELRTPLNAIIGYGEMLEEEAQDLGQEGFIPDLKKIQSAGKHLLGLISDILDLSKIEAGKMDLFLETFAIPEMIEDVSTTIRPLIEKNANTLTCHIGENVETMHADMIKVRQILFNLLSNASKFTEHGTIDLSVDACRDEAGEQWVTFSVKDSGIGMSPEQLEKLFQAFTQADASTTRKFGGTGLGLTIIKHFCEMMKGRIEVRSEIGKGSTFTACIPARVGIDEPAEAAPFQPNAGGESILVIDDDPVARDLLERYLLKQGYTVTLAESGEEGLRLAEKIQPDVITLDVMMKGMDGWTVLSAIKNNPNLANIPVIMLTMVDDRNLGYALGASDYLTKPINRAMLSLILKRHHKHFPEKCRILVVEDDASTRDIICRTLEKSGFSIIEAENGLMALNKLTENPSIILLDLMMPEMDGFEFIAKLREIPDHQMTPVIVVTAKELTEEDRMLLNGKVSNILQKGAHSRDELLSELGGLIRSSLIPN
ncbi:MAG: response regulator [Burkholderiales bacterium]|nr:response regulator [Burkholderiales bacterium]